MQDVGSAEPKVLLAQTLESQPAFLSTRSRLALPRATFFLTPLLVDPSSRAIPYRPFLLMVLSRIVLSSEPGSTKIPTFGFALTWLFLILVSLEFER